MEVGWGCEGKRKGRRKHASRRVYTVYGILSLFQGNSPGGATVILCMICYVFCRAAAWGCEEKGKGTASCTMRTSFWVIRLCCEQSMCCSFVSKCNVTSLHGWLAEINADELRRLHNFTHDISK